MKPAPGRYVLTSTTPPANPPLSMSVQVDATGLDCSFGRMDYDEPNDWFFIPGANVVIRCEGAGTFSALVAPGTPQQRLYAGTCVGPV
jgi:hypothetical protein